MYFWMFVFCLGVILIYIKMFDNAQLGFLTFLTATIDTFSNCITFKLHGENEQDSEVYIYSHASDQTGWDHWNVAYITF